jgi:glucosamine-6-phosphate deaminase
MEVIIKPDPPAVSKEAAGIFRQQLAAKPHSVLGLGTGGTPLGLYRQLVAMHREGQIDFSHVTTFNLDEYVGLGPNHPQSYRFYMWEHFFRSVNVDLQRTHVPDGLALNVPEHCERYEDAIREAGGIDLQLLGIGVDAHIGFNEPGSALGSRTRIKTLTPQTIADNARFFGSEQAVPHHVITMGIGTILDARHCLVLATGKNKADAVAAMVEGSLTAMVPASALQFHRKCTLIVDEEAAAKLAKCDYYRWVYDHKPEWQRV